MQKRRPAKPLNSGRHGEQILESFNKPRNIARPHLRGPIVKFKVELGRIVYHAPLTSLPKDQLNQWWSSSQG